MDLQGDRAGTSGTWHWFADLTNNKLRRSAHRGVTELEATSANGPTRGTRTPGRVVQPGTLIIVTTAPKAADLTALVNRLRSDLGDDYFAEVQHWDGDQTAIGLGNPANPHFLVYLSLHPGDAAVYVECERPATKNAPDMPYEVASSGLYTGYGQILSIVRDHLAH